MNHVVIFYKQGRRKVRLGVTFMQNRALRHIPQTFPSLKRAQEFVREMRL